jgi:hypothetical protein
VFAPAVLAVASLLPAQPAAKPFELKDGDRVVWIGSTLVEREQRYGYWETALIRVHLDRRFTLRNLGWSGDTVWGESRGRFDYSNPDVCFKQLVDQTLALKPTVIFVSYGTNESFEGEAGLVKFEQGLNRLLDALKPAKARIVLFTPLPFQADPNYPDPTERNKTLALYCDTIRALARKREHHIADLYATCPVLPPGATENGMHLTEEGYKATAVTVFLGSLVQGRRVIDWDQVEPFRKAVIEKNQLFFHRWRPQNETYLFGFRKHEQGKNAKEVAEFDPLVSKAEDEIDSIRRKLVK